MPDDVSVKLVTLNTQLLPLPALPSTTARRLLGELPFGALSKALEHRVPAAWRRLPGRTGARIGEGSSEAVDRADAIADALIAEEPDVVCLQEVFHPGARAHLIARLSPFLPFVVEPHAETELRASSGLVTFSRYPVLLEPSTLTWSRAEGTDRLAQKGALITSVLVSDPDIPGATVTLVIANTHLQAGPSWRVRRHQLRELRRGLNAVATKVLALPDETFPDNNSSAFFALVGGDLNIDGAAGDNDDTHSIRLSLGAGDLEVVDATTWIDEKGPVDSSKVATNSDGRLDYWLFVPATSSRLDASVTLEGRPLEMRARGLSDHDGWLARITGSNELTGAPNDIADVIDLAAGIVVGYLDEVNEFFDHRPAPLPRAGRPRIDAELAAQLKHPAGGQTFKPVGHRHAMSDIVHAGPRGVTLDLGWMRRVPYPSLPPDTKRPPPRLRFDAGATVGQLNRALGADRDRAPSANAHKPSWSLPAQPGYGGLTWVGTMSVGGHGSGAGLGALSSHVTRMTVRPPRNAVPVELSWDSDPEGMRAALVGLGLVGVITEVEVALVEGRNIAEIRERRPWSQLRHQLDALTAWNERPADPEGGRNARPHSFEIWLNPYEPEQTLLGRRWWTDDPVSGRRGLTQRESVVAVAAQRVLNRRDRRHRLDLPGVSEAQQMALASARTPDRIVLSAAAGLSFGAPNHLSVIASSVAVPWAELAAALDTVSATCLRMAREDEGARYRRILASPVGVRIVKNERCQRRPYLAPQFPSTLPACVPQSHPPATHQITAPYTAMIEMPTMRAFRGAEETLTTLVRALVDQHHGRPHWGQFLPITADDVTEMYGRDVDRFVALRRVLDPDGRFSNAFSRRLGLDPPPSDP